MSTMYRRTFFLLFVVSVLAQAGYVSAWTAPTQAPPSGNVSAPINVGTVDQVKNAGLSLNSLAVYGNAILSGVSRYLNFGSTAGSGGYGIRDNAGVMEIKDTATGQWSRIATTSVSGGGIFGGTLNYLSKYSSANTLTESILFDNGTNVGISTSSPAQKFSVAGKIYSASGGFQFPDGTTQTTAFSANSVAGSSDGIHARVYTTTSTFTVPSGIDAVETIVIGGGGGGGGGCGGGGGGAGSAVKWMTGLVPGTSMTVTVGAGGAGGAALNGTGGTGGTSVFNGVSAVGGTGGTHPLGGAGGSASGGSLALAGTTGAEGVRSLVGTCAIGVGGESRGDFSSTVGYFYGAGGNGGAAGGAGAAGGGGLVIIRY